MRQMDLLNWNPPCQIVVFPLTRRVGRIREVAESYVSKSDKAAAHYLSQVTGGLFAQLNRIGVPEDQQDEMLGAFVDALEREVARLMNQCRPGGAA